MRRERCDHVEVRTSGVWRCKRAPHGPIKIRVLGDLVRLGGHYMTRLHG